ncbi:MAG: hypothetical protein Q9166_002672 [cf. Caloplaca sp. 2 TL-2023]
MKSTYTISLLCLAAVHPLTATAQGGRGNRGGGNRDWYNRPVFGPPVETPPATAVVVAPITSVGNTFVNTRTQAPGTVTRIQGDGDGNGRTTTAQPPTNTGGGSTTPGTSSGDCAAAVQGNMNVRISGDSVAYRFEPPVAGNPTTGTIGDCPVWSFPPGWSGRVHVGGGPGAPNGGTLFEGNVAGGGGQGAMDVSYVEGFSVPMLCTDNTNNFVSGCGIDLFSVGTCPTGGSAGGVCRNPQGPGGDRDSALPGRQCEECSPPDAFFAPCAGAAYAFPDDDDAVDGQSGLDITCVVGASSQRTGREGSTAETGNAQVGRCVVCPEYTSAKRSLENVLFGRGVESSMARSPSMLPRVHKKSIGDILGRRSHRHGVAHGSNVR